MHLPKLHNEEVYHTVTHTLLNKATPFQQSIISLINSKLLALSINRSGTHKPKDLLRLIQDFIHKVGFVSQRFSQTILPSINLFFSSNTFTISLDDLHQFKTIASIFGTHLNSIRLLCHVGSSSEWTLDQSTTSSVTSLSCVYWGHPFDFLSHASPSFCPRLSALTVELDQYSHLPTSLKESLSITTSVSLLTITNTHFDGSKLTDFVDILTVNKSLRVVKLFCRLNDAAYINICNALSKNKFIKEFYFSEHATRIELPFVKLLMSKTSLKILKFPLFGHQCPDILTALKSNSSLCSVSFTNTTLLSEKIAQILISNRFLKSLKLHGCTIRPAFGYLFNTLQHSESLLELSITDTNYPLYYAKFSIPDGNSLETMLKMNTSLQSLEISNFFFSCSTVISCFFKGLSTSSTLKHLRLSGCSLQLVLKCYEALVNNLNIRIDLRPHSLDLQSCVIVYQGPVFDGDLNTLLDVMKSGVCLSRVDCGDWSRKGFDGFVALCELYSINKSLITVDLTPNVIDVDNGLFIFDSYPAHSYWEIGDVSQSYLTKDSVINLHSVIQTFGLQKVVIRNCRFSEDAFELLKTDTTTSFSFQNCYSRSERINTD
ncbi:hypothetical protein GEMRC1_002080 [Eukaryota sp. GEM-RC1]